MTKRESDLVSEVRILRSELDILRGEENKLLINRTKVIEAQSMELSRLESLLRQATNELRSSKDNTQNRGEQDGVLVAELRILKSQVNEKNKKLEEMKDELKMKVTEGESLKKRIMHETKRLEANSVEASSQAVCLSQENTKLKEQIFKLKKSQESTENKVFELQADLAMQSAQVKTMKDRLKIEGNSGSVRIQLKEAQEKNSELRQKLIESDKERSHLKEQLVDMKSVEGDWESKLAEKERSLNTNLQIIDELEKRIDRFQKRADKSDNSSNELDHVKSLLAQRIEDMNVIEKDNESLKSENEQLLSKLEQLKQKVSLIHDEVRLSKQQMTSSIGSGQLTSQWPAGLTTNPGLGQFENKYDTYSGIQGLSEDSKKLSVSQAGSQAGHDQDSSFNKAMIRANGDVLQAGVTPSQTASRISVQADHLEVDSKLDLKLKEIALHVETSKRAQVENSSQLKSSKQSIEMTATVSQSANSLANSATIDVNMQTVQKSQSSTSNFGVGDRMIGRMSSLEELVKVLERENLLLVRKFEASRKEVNQKNDQIDNNQSVLREFKLREDELYSNIEVWKSKVQDREREVNKLQYEVSQLIKEKDTYLARLREEEELGPGVTRDREWHDALFRMNEDAEKRNREIERLREQNKLILEHAQRLEEKAAALEELENTNIILKAKMEDLQEKIAMAEDEANYAKEQLRRIAQDQVKSEMIAAKREDSLADTIGQQRQALEHKIVC